MDMNRPTERHTTVYSAYFCFASAVFHFWKVWKVHFLLERETSLSFSWHSVIEDLHKHVSKCTRVVQLKLHCRAQVQMLNIPVKSEGLRHWFCCNRRRADLREPRWVYFISRALEDATMLDILFKRRIQFLAHRRLYLGRFVSCL